MALIKPSPFITDIRGSVGGTVFQQGNSGLILRTKTTPVNRNTSGLNRSRNVIFLLQQKWLDMRERERIQWKRAANYAKINQQNISGKFINGQQMFIRYNAYRLNLGFVFLKRPSFSGFQTESISIDISKSGNNMLVDYGRLLDSTKEFVILFLTFEVKDTINNPGNRFRLMVFQSGDEANRNITQQYTAVFGRIPGTGHKLFAKWSLADKSCGLVMPFQQQSFTFE